MYIKVKLSDLDRMCENSEPIWVFGYGSLLWKPEFPYSKRETGFISGYKRRFWQGNCTHRGTKEKPGRVVTIVQDSQEAVWGDAFKVEGPGKRKALGNLVKREVTLGGYDIICTRFTSRDNATARTVIVYAATQRNSYYLGDSDVDTMSSEIVDAHGHCGSNVEYVVNLAEYCRTNIPEDNDPHLFELERKVKELLIIRSINLAKSKTYKETLLDHETMTENEMFQKSKTRIYDDMYIDHKERPENMPNDLDSCDCEEDCDTDSSSAVDSDEESSMQDSE